MDIPRLAKWLLWFGKLARAVIDFITSNPHPDHDDGQVKK